MGKFKLLAVLAVVIAITMLLKSYAKDKKATNAGREFLSRAFKATVIGAAIVIVLALLVMLFRHASSDQYSGGRPRLPIDASRIA